MVPARFSAGSESWGVLDWFDYDYEYDYEHDFEHGHENEREYEHEHESDKPARSHTPGPISCLVA
jgi:hypothetical protein